MRLKEKLPFPTEIEIETLNGGLHRLSGGTLYLHPKGYMGARNTHLDLTHPSLFGIISLKRGGIYAKARRNGDWVTIIVPSHNKKIFGASRLSFNASIFSKVFSEDEGWVWVGAKEGGLVIGVRKDQLKILERILESLVAQDPNV